MKEMNNILFILIIFSSINTNILKTKIVMDSMGGRGGYGKAVNNDE